MGFDIPIVSLELPAYSKKENWGRSDFYQIVRNLLKDKSEESKQTWQEEKRRPRVNLLGQLCQTLVCLEWKC